MRTFLIMISLFLFLCGMPISIRSQNAQNTIVTWSGNTINGVRIGNNGGNIAIFDPNFGNRDVTLAGGWQWLGIPTGSNDHVGQNRVRYSEIIRDLGTRVRGGSSNSVAPVMFEVGDIDGRIIQEGFPLGQIAKMENKIVHFTIIG